jgi:hypothetical protein
LITAKTSGVVKVSSLHRTEVFVSHRHARLTVHGGRLLVERMCREATAGPAGICYSPAKEPNFKVTDTVSGQTVRQSKWVDWNQYVDEQSFALGLRDKLVAAGFDSGLGMLIDTSRNGNNPTGALPNAPLAGHWFSAQFRQLMQNAYPPLP